MPRWSAERRWALIIGSLLGVAGAAAAVIYAGLYNIAADVPHTQPVLCYRARVAEPEPLPHAACNPARSARRCDTSS